MSYINQVIIFQFGPLSCTLPKKAFLSPFSLGKKRIYLETHLKGEFTDLL